MGKEGKDRFGTRKVANQMKSAGLQRLRWFCQMCQKQCRDANGFKCHEQSEGHLRQMALFRENPVKYIDNYSKLFEGEFMRVLRAK